MKNHQEERLQRYADGSMEPSERADFEREMAASDEGISALYDELAVRAALEERGARRAKPRALAPRRRRWIPATFAAAAVVLLAVFLQWPEDPDTVFRSGAAAGPRAVEPIGAVESVPTRFVWTPRADAAAYRVEIFDTKGERAFTQTTTDTFLVIPADAAQPRGAWKTTALDDLGLGEASSGRVEFWTEY